MSRKANDEQVARAIRACTVPVISGVGHEIDFTIARVSDVVAKLRDMSPLWDMVQAGIDLNSIQWAEH